MMDDLKARLRITYCEHRNKGVCLHSEAPYIFVLCRADVLYCDELLKDNRCPLLPLLRRDKWEAVRV